LANSEDWWDYFIMAMAECQLGNREAALQWYAKALDWLKARPQIVGGDPIRYRVEAEELLGVSTSVKPAAKTTTE